MGPHADDAFANNSGEEFRMRAFLSAVVIAVVIAGGGAVLLNKFQEPAQEAYSTDAVRL
jgi:hypothetical protein